MTSLKCHFAAALLVAATIVAQHSRAGIALVVTTPQSPPPAVRVEHPGTSPFKDAVWIDGRWDWRDGQYVWVTGHWERAPNGHRHWQNGQWSQRNGSWFFRAGRWL